MRRARLLIVVALLAAACGDGDAEVFPFSEVQGSDFVFETDPLATDRGIFRVVTTEPMICAIVWGETEALGNLNNSLDMNGTGITDHNVFLPGAVPGRTYYFRVQGSSADGRLFQSELSTFVLPASEAPPPESSPAPGTNLALGAVVLDVSSEFGASWSAANALDGDLTTEWSSRGDGDDAHLTIDLGAEAQVDALEFLTRSMADGSAVTTTFVVVVDDRETLGPFAAGNPADPRPAEVSFRGRVLRFEVASSSGGNTGAVEIRVLGTAGRDAG
jgi:hypothetical protein